MVIAIVSLVTLFLSNRDQESITFLEEVEGLDSKLDLMVVHVLSRPEKGWEGEKGRIDASVLSRGLTGVENNTKTLTASQPDVGHGYEGPMYCLSCNLRFFALDSQWSRLERTVSR